MPLLSSPRQRSDSVVLVFARSPRAEATAKPGLGGERVARLCREGVRRAVAASGLPAVYVDERQQRGRSFGERLAVACAQVLGAGYEHLVVVGGDCPELRGEDLRAAAQTLADGRSVLGRDRRGGAYLLGVTRDVVEAPGFERLPWCTRSLANAFVRHVGGRDTAVDLPTRRDLNDAGDVRDVARRLRGLVGWAGGARVPTAAGAATCGVGVGFGESHYRRGPPATD